MLEYVELLILFGVGILAGFVNVMAGGGSSLTLPALIFLGLDGSAANGTNRVAILIQNVSAALSFHKQKVPGIREGVKLAAFTLPGAILGALIAVRISSDWFERILGIVMIGVVISMLLPSQAKRNITSVEGKKPWLIYPAMLGIGFYGGFIQIGVGFLIMAALYHLLRINLILVNVRKILIILIYTVPALLIFIWTDNVDWLLGLSLAAGNALGGWWAAHLSVEGGEKVIRSVLVVAIFIISLKLLQVF